MDFEQLSQKCWVCSEYVYGGDECEKVPTMLVHHTCVDDDDLKANNLAMESVRDHHLLRKEAKEFNCSLNKLLVFDEPNVCQSCHAVKSTNVVKYCCDCFSRKHSTDEKLDTHKDLYVVNGNVQKKPHEEPDELQEPEQPEENEELTQKDIEFLDSLAGKQFAKDFLV